MNNCKKECPLLSASLIPLTQGKYSIVDTNCYNLLSGYKWQILNTSYGISARRGSYRPNGKSLTVLMHRQIMSCPDGMLVDHENHNTSDNRRQNLRVCTRQQNNANRMLNCNSISGVKGVFKRESGKYRVRIRFNTKSISVGEYDTLRDAAIAYNDKAKELFGEFAYLNDITGEIK